MKRCPYCNSDRGVYTIFKAMQYYSWDGEPEGYSTDELDESKFAKCLSCDRKISMKRIQKNTETDILRQNRGNK